MTSENSSDCGGSNDHKSMREGSLLVSIWIYDKIKLIFGMLGNLMLWLI